MKPVSKWWDGYEQEDYVLLDDVEEDSLKYIAHYLKLWADPYGYLTGEVKGAKVSLNYKVLIVTSNYTIQDCVNKTHPSDNQLLRALRRRFQEIKVLGYPLEQKIIEQITYAQDPIFKNEWILKKSI